MPMERERYPKDWRQLSLSIKDESEWRCRGCKKQCFKPGEKLSDFIIRVFGGIEGEAWREAADHPGRFRLTVAHLDQDPKNNEPSNLKALCNVCHLQNDRPHQKANSLAKKERRGQKKLSIGEKDYAVNGTTSKA